VEGCGTAADCRKVVRRRSEGREGGGLGRNGVELGVEMEVKEEEEEMKSRTKGDPVTHTREQHCSRQFKWSERVSWWRSRAVESITKRV
jgi:hypothetical protein